MRARAALHLDGRGDFCNMILCELAPGKSTAPQRHLFEEVIYVVAGSGSTQLTLPNGERRSFEWGERSLFAIPLNAEYRHFNGSGSKRALLVSTTNLPMMLNLFHSERFVFGNGFEFDDRIGKKEYFEGEGVLTLLRQGNDTWETNFVPDIGTIELPDFSDRGAGGGCLIFLLSDSSMHAHVSEMPAGTYKKAHRHGAGYHVMCVGGSGYSLMWHEGQRDFVRIDWTHGVVFPPADQQFHQHFTTSKVPARYLATGFGSLRYPFTRRGGRRSSARRSHSRPAPRKAATRSNTRTRIRASIRYSSPRWKSTGSKRRWIASFRRRAAAAIRQGSLGSTRVISS